MAQYYSIVTNPSGTLTLEDVQQMCSVEGQSIQFVVQEEDPNNGVNSAVQFVPYTPTSDFSPQTINLGGQVPAGQLDPRQNLYIIKTNDPAQNIMKSSVGTQVITENVVSIVENRGSPKSPVNNSPPGQNMQWLKMPENNANFDAVHKQNTLIPIKGTLLPSTPTRNQQQNNSPQQVSLQGQRTQLEPQLYSPMEKKPPSRLYHNKNKLHNQSMRQVGSNTAQGAVSSSPQLGNTLCSPADRLITSNSLNNKNCTAPPRYKTFGPALPPEMLHTPVKQIRQPVRQDTPMPRNVGLVPVSKSPPGLLYTENPKYLSEKIKQAQLNKQQQQPQMAITPQFERQLLQQSTQQQQVTTNMGQQLRQHMPVTPQQQRQQMLTSPAQRQQMMANTGQQRLQQMALTPQQQAQLQRHPMMMTPQQRHQHQVMALAPGQLGQLPVEVDLPDSSSEESGKLSQQSCGSQTDGEYNSSESYAYLQKVIDNPHTTIVQKQISGNTAKMLVVLPNGEQRLITFDIPNEDCTVQDLLEQAKIVFCGETNVSLVSDPALGINYIVEAGPGTLSNDGSELSDSNPSLDNIKTSPDSSSPVFNPSDENSNSSITLNEEPKYVDGKLAVCNNCGISSIDFNRCQRCRRKLPEDVKSIPMTMALQAKQENMLAVDVRTFYKKNNERNPPAKLEKPDRELQTARRGRGRGRPAARAKPIKEPECLTISSDEEDDEGNKSKKSDTDNGNTTFLPANNSRNDGNGTILEKEPVITNNSISSSSESNMETEEGIKGGGRECEEQSMVDGSIQPPHTSLVCRTVRIGSYKYIPRERVVISQSGLRLIVPLLEDTTSYVLLDVKFKEIVKVLIHFGKALPVLFFYTTTATAATIRELLGMQDPKGPYYDPAGKDHTHKRITLLPEKMSEDSKVVLKNLFTPNDLLEELSGKEANDILLRASPKDNSQVQNLMRKQTLPVSSSNNTSINGGIQTIMVYPPPPAKGGIAINTEDYACLGEDQFLNDVIIDFYLKYLTLEVLSEEDQNRTHVFSSYFYKRLTSPHAVATESSVPLSAAAKRHARVQKWTKNVNIFEKDFIVIPINEHAHWFLAIICFPGLVGKVPVSLPKVKESDVKKTVQKSKKLKELKLQAVTIGSTTITPVTTTITLDPGDDGSERDEAEGDDEEMEVDSEEEETEDQEDNATKQPKPRAPTPPQKEIHRLPCILIFDSLAGASRSRVVATLRDYLSCEYSAKLGIDKTFSKDTIKGACPKVPQQSNFTDCGVYLLQYVESFFNDPIKDYTLPIKTLKKWFEEIIVTRKREELSKLLVTLMNATKGDKNITLPVLTFPTEDGKLLPKPENHVEMKPVKSEPESKKKPNADAENRTSISTEENAEPMNETMNRTVYHQIIPYSSSSNSSSTEGSQAELFTETKTPRSSSETMNYLKTKRIQRNRPLQRTSESQDDKQITKKHKGDSFDSCK